MALMRLSYSKLVTFEQCALRYRYAYVERLPGPPVTGLVFQRRMHTALANYHQFARRDGTVAESDLLEGYERLLTPEQREKASYAEGRDILLRYASRENALAVAGEPRVPAYLEKTLDVSSFGPYRLTGRLDRLDFPAPGAQGYCVVDYKFDRAIPPDSAAQESRQLPFYALLASEALGVTVSEARLLYLRHGVEQSVPQSRATLRETVGWIDGLASRIRAEQRWRPKEGQGCVSCPFKAQCPAKTGKARPLKGVWRQGSMNLEE